MRVLLFITVLFSLLGCQSFKNRTPQSAGFGGYCPECLVKNIDEDISQLKDILQQKTSGKTTNSSKIKSFNLVYELKDEDKGFLKSLQVEVIVHKDKMTPTNKLIHYKGGAYVNGKVSLKASEVCMATESVSFNCPAKLAVGNINILKDCKIGNSEDVKLQIILSPKKNKVIGVIFDTLECIGDRVKLGRKTI